MVHKIHMGSSLPSVKAGTPYTISSADYSDVVNPSPSMACQVCHEPKSVSGAAQADNWLTQPTRDTCGSCHDDVNFATGKGHLDLPQVSDNLCHNCHQPDSGQEFDASIKGAHVVGTHSAQLQGVNYKIESITDVAPGKKPTVVFTVKDDKGNPIALSGMSSTRLYMAGPVETDFATYVREDAIKAPGSNGRYTYTFTKAIPADAKGNWQFGMEGYRNVKLNAGTTTERSVRDLGHNIVVYAAVDGSKAVPRRSIVDTAKCEKCHMSLEFHGGNRNAVEMCSFCHNPSLTVKESNGTELSYNFPNMIHRFHAEARYPGILSNCEQCHVAGAQSLPLNDGLLSTTNPAAPEGMNPTPPQTNACLSCHGENASAWSHANANTTTFGESCAVCHATGKDFAVEKVHAQ
jgi:OmcA/MtrC family decaheme c-type cytochrome